MRFYLASTSPARLATLRAAGLDPIPVAPEVDEDAVVAAARGRGEAATPPDVVRLLARAKALAVADATRTSAPDRRDLVDGLVFGGDSMFELDGTLYGKPHTPEVARTRWRMQRGRTGILWSGHWLVDRRAGVDSDGDAAEGVGAVSSARVAFADDIDDAEIDAYIETGEPLEVAGAFTIEGRGAAFVESIEGDPSTVVGLSVPTLRRLVRRLGVEWPALW